MPLQRFASRIVRRYGSDITSRVGGDLNGVSFVFGNTGALAASGTGITVNRDWWQNASRADRRGALIHELTHVATRDQGLTGSQAELTAEAVRYSLNGQVGMNRDYAPGYEQYARQHGWLGGNMANGPGNNGPRVGRGTGRNRNTVANGASKDGTWTTQSYQAPVSSSSAVQYGDQLANARYSYLSQLAALKAQRTLVGQQYGTAVADARSQAVTDMTTAEGSALDRGVLGGSNDMSNRAGVLAARQRAFADAEAQRALSRLQLGQQAIDARGQYYQSVSGIQNAMAQEQMANTIGAFQNDQFDALQQNYQDVLAQIRALKRGDGTVKRRGINGLLGAPTYQQAVGDGTLNHGPVHSLGPHPH